jgi:hypothetical protein
VSARELLLEEYRVERQRGELVRDLATMGYPTERAMQKAEGSAQPVTLKDWMRQTQQPAQPDDLERARVTAMLWGQAQDVHEAMAQAQRDYQSATLARDETFTQLVESGETFQAVATMMRVTRQAVHASVKRHRERCAA